MGKKKKCRNCGHFKKNEILSGTHKYIRVYRLSGKRPAGNCLKKKNTKFRVYESDPACRDYK